MVVGVARVPRLLDVELAEGGLYRIYRDRASDKWYADGMYD